jgi:hypothetical protein
LQQVILDHLADGAGLSTRVELLVERRA